jgi:8-oxo-dGTP diphosphatase
MLHHYGMHDKRHRRSTGESAFKVSVALNVLLAMCLFYVTVFAGSQDSAARDYLTSKTDNTIGREMVWYGGHPKTALAGSCWCGQQDGYCLCTPNVAIDLIILSSNHDVWLVRRKDTNQLATMGGFVDVDETVEHAVRRELQEEMGISLKEPPRLFGVYSDPRRDNRRRTVSVVFAVHVDEEVHPRAGDDAKEVKRISLNDIEKYSFFADHRTILLDYRRFLRHEAPVLSSEGDFATDITRSTCAASP